MSEVRLGDIIEDYCTRCGRLLDHSVVAIVGADVKKVRCRTCDHEHDFRHGKGGEKKKTKQKTAFEQVLASLGPPAAGQAASQEKRAGSRRGARRETE